MAAFFIDLNQNQYAPGHVLSGTFTCIFDGPEKIQDIEIKVRGEEHTKWLEKTDTCDLTSLRKRPEELIQYSGYNKLLSRKVTMPGVNFQPGQYTYRFSFQLPRDIPGSYVASDGGDHNSVTYYVKISIKKAGEGGPKVVVKNFDVIAPVDLKNSVDKSHKVERTENGLLKLSACLEKNILLIGDEVELRVTIANPAKIRVDKISAEVAVNIEATALDPTKMTRTYYTSLESQDIVFPVDDIGKNRYIFRLKIPGNADVPNLIGCKLFKLSSSIKVSAILPTYKDVIIILPIVLGHVISSPSPIDNQTEPFLYEDIFELLLDYQHSQHVRHETPVAQYSILAQDSEPNTHSNSNTESGVITKASTEVSHPLQPAAEGYHTPTVVCPNLLVVDPGIKPESVNESPNVNPSVIEAQPLLQKSSPNVDTPATEPIPLVISFHASVPSSETCPLPQCSPTLAAVDDVHIVSTSLLMSSPAPDNPDVSSGNDVICSTKGLWEDRGDGGLTHSHGGGWVSSNHVDDNGDCCDCDCDCGDCDCDCGDCDCECGDCDCECDDCVIL